MYLATGPDAATDRMVHLLVISALLVLASAQQREFKAKFEDCGEFSGFTAFTTILSSGSILDIAPAIQGSVSITAPFNRKTKRHVLFKVITLIFEGEQNNIFNRKERRKIIIIF